MASVDQAFAKVKGAVRHHVEGALIERLGHAIGYLAEQHSAARELAQRERLEHSNAHVYGVDENYKLY